MRCFSPYLIALGLAFAATASAQTAEPQSPARSMDMTAAVAEPVPQPASAASAKQALSMRDAAVLGLVEGITEFLPISSTGHLIIASRALGLEGDAPLFDAAGETIWLKKPSAEYPAGVPLTLTAAADTYLIVIQVGAIAAVVLIYWAQLMGILRGLLGKNAAGVRLLRNILLAFLPCVILALAIEDWIDDNLFSIRAVVAALVSGAVLMFFAERWRKNNPMAQDSRRTPADLTAKQSVGIGVMQCLALWPGMSRSMVTMVGGYFAGLTPARAAEFSFLVGLPTLTGAAVYKGAGAGPAMIQVFGWTQVLFGMVVAAVSAGLAVKFLVSYLGRHGLGVFAVYRLILAAVLMVWFMA